MPSQQPDGVGVEWVERAKNVLGPGADHCRHGERETFCVWCAYGERIALALRTVEAETWEASIAIVAGTEDVRFETNLFISPGGTRLPGASLRSKIIERLRLRASGQARA